MSAGLLFETVEHFPDLLALHNHNPQRYPCLLESVAHGTAQARYDILFAFPGERITLESFEQGDDFLDQLDQAWQQQAMPGIKDTHLPFRGGWFVYLGYELAGQIEPSLHLPASESKLPVAFALRIPAAIIRDHATGRCWLVSESDPDQIDSMRADVVTATQKPEAFPRAPTLQLQEEPASRYLDAVERIKRYIVDGDVFQVNLSREWCGEAKLPNDIALYASLRHSNPAPFAGLVRLDDFAIISSSPERLVCIEGRHVETRPIAGTRPRGEARDSDDANSRELLAHPKERAEHIMLIDLERNDLGRVCKPGSIEVNELMVLESYAHVHHIVSNVRGELRNDTTPCDVIRAVFPGGTITGCPKVRCMEIIAELEQAPRGAYTGSIGYLNHDGDMDLNILIRTITREANTIKLRAGAGIVADSDAERELDETRAKARGMLLALHGRGER